MLAYLHQITFSSSSIIIDIFSPKIGYPFSIKRMVMVCNLKTKSLE